MQRTIRDLNVSQRLDLAGTRVLASADDLNKSVGMSGYPVQAQSVLFTEAGAGTYTGTVTLPAGSTLIDIIVDGIALWAAATSATMKVGATDDDGYYTGVNLKATDLLAGESISFALAGGKAGAYIANSQVSPRYFAAATAIKGIVTSEGAGTTGRTRMTVVYATPGDVSDAVKS